MGIAAFGSVTLVAILAAEPPPPPAPVPEAAKAPAPAPVSEEGLQLMTIQTEPLPPENVFDLQVTEAAPGIQIAKAGKIVEIPYAATITNKLDAPLVVSWKGGALIDTMDFSPAPPKKEEAPKEEPGRRRRPKGPPRVEIPPKGAQTIAEVLRVVPKVKEKDDYLSTFGVRFDVEYFVKERQNRKLIPLEDSSMRCLAREELLLVVRGAVGKEIRWILNQVRGPQGELYPVGDFCRLPEGGRFEAGGTVVTPVLAAPTTVRYFELLAGDYEEVSLAPGDSFVWVTAPAPGYSYVTAVDLGGRPGPDSRAILRIDWVTAIEPTIRGRFVPFVVQETTLARVTPPSILKPADLDVAVQSAVEGKKQTLVLSLDAPDWQEQAKENSVYSIEVKAIRWALGSSGKIAAQTPFTLHSDDGGKSMVHHVVVEPDRGGAFGLIVVFEPYGMETQQVEVRGTARDAKK